MSSSFFPNGCGVTIETQDGPLDLSDVSWQMVASCGCVAGLMLGAIPGELTVTVDDARKRFAETEVERTRNDEHGFTYRAREHKAACAEAKFDCTHDPRYGYEKPPKPEGYVWAAVHALGARPKYTHLVTEAHVNAVLGHDYSTLDEKPLCGSKPAYHWHTEWYATSGKVECKRCIAKARQMVGAA